MLVFVKTINSWKLSMYACRGCIETNVNVQYVIYLHKKLVVLIDKLVYCLISEIRYVSKFIRGKESSRLCTLGIIRNPIQDSSTFYILRLQNILSS